MDKVDILGVKVNKTITDQVLRDVRYFLSDGRQHYIVTTNPEFIMAAQDDEVFKKILNEADLSVPDGIGLLWASRYLENRKQRTVSSHALKISEFCKLIASGSSLVFYPKYCKTVLPERIAGIDLIWKIAKLCEQQSCSVFLLGGRNRVGETTAKKLKHKYSNLKIAGVFEGSAGIEDDEKLRVIVNNKKPDVLLVAFGQVKQEKWIVRNLDRLKSVKLAMGVGGSFDFISGQSKRAPRFFRKTGLEWLWRVSKEPWRFNRIVSATYYFVNQVYRYKVNKTN